MAVIGAFSLCFCVAARDQESLSVLEALPTTNVLGSNWSRHISVLFDPASQPAEIVAVGSQLPEARKQEHRNAVANPTNRISGWSHVHYEFQGTNGNQRYELQVDRYRSESSASEDFRKLLASDTKEYQKTEIQGIGEEAVVYRGASGMTLWFRRGAFRVWLSPLFGTRRWEDDSALQQLARAFDARLKTGRTTEAKPKKA